jgi:hypothetical protein
MKAAGIGHQASGFGIRENLFHQAGSRNPESGSPGMISTKAIIYAQRFD